MGLKFFTPKIRNPNRPKPNPDIYGINYINFLIKIRNLDLNEKSTLNFAILVNLL